MPVEPKTYFCDYCGFSEMCMSYYYRDPVAIFSKSLSRCVKYRKGDVIVTEGETADRIFAIISGVIKVYEGEDIMALALPGEVVGADGIGDKKYPTTLMAATDVQVCTLDINDFYGLSQVTVDFTTMITQLISRAVIEKQRLISTLLIEDSTRRLLSYLQMTMQKYKRAGENYHRFTLPVTRKELAKILAMSPSTLARSLGILVKDKFISIDNRTITLHEAAVINDVHAGGR